MSLQFPNTSRFYDGAHSRVTFWGHDSAFEIMFHVDEDVLRRFAPRGTPPHDGPDEAASLLAFDANRQQIERAASSVYGRHRRPPRLSSHRLSMSDF